jgi:hypothetical protein
VVLFAGGIRLRIPAIGLARLLARSAVVGAAVAVTIFANMALYRHDLQFDLTREQAFTPSAEAQEIVRGLKQPVQLTYFYQKQDPAGRGAATIVQLLSRLNPRLEVDVIDSDQHPALANQMGVQVYNTAVVRAGDRRIQVIATDEEEIALAILRAIRTRETVICFAIGHGEYDTTILLSIRISKAPRATATTSRALPWCRCSSTASAGCGGRSRSSASLHAKR